jgi:hypothetical protein
VQAKEEVKPEPEPEPDVPDDDFGDFDLDNGDDGCMWGDLLSGGDDFSHSAYGEEAPMRQPPEAVDPQAEIAKLHAQQSQEVYDSAMARKIQVGLHILFVHLWGIYFLRVLFHVYGLGSGAIPWGWGGVQPQSLWEGSPHAPSFGSR